MMRPSPVALTFASTRDMLIYDTMLSSSHSCIATCIHHAAPPL